MLHSELLDRVGTRVHDWEETMVESAVAILHMKLLAMMVDRKTMVEDLVVAMSKVEWLTRVVTIIQN